MGGAGCGLVLVQGNVTVQQYFDKRCHIFFPIERNLFQIRRGIANGIFMSGGALGNMLMPVLLRLETLTLSSIFNYRHSKCSSVYSYLFLKQFHALNMIDFVTSDGENCRHSINWFGFRGALLVHSACLSTTLLAATTFR